MRVKHFIIDLWAKHSTGVTCAMAIVLLTISTAIGIIGGLVHIAYTLHKHYLLIKNNNMKKGEKTAIGDSDMVTNVATTESSVYVQPRLTYESPFDVKKTESVNNEAK